MIDEATHTRILSIPYATHQHKLMHRLILSENAKRVRREVDNVTRGDVVSLFGLYSDAKGQMAINKLGKIRGLPHFFAWHVHFTHAAPYSLSIRPLQINV